MKKIKDLKVELNKIKKPTFYNDHLDDIKLDDFPGVYKINPEFFKLLHLKEAGLPENLASLEIIITFFKIYLRVNDLFNDRYFPHSPYFCPDDQMKKLLEPIAKENNFKDDLSCMDSKKFKKYLFKLCLKYDEDSKFNFNKINKKGRQAIKLFNKIKEMEIKRSKIECKYFDDFGNIKIYPENLKRLMLRIEIKKTELSTLLKEIGYYIKFY